MLDILATIPPEIQQAIEKTAETAAIKAAQDGHEIIYWLLGICLVSIIGLYAFMIGYYLNVTKELAKIYTLVNSHVQNDEIHAKKKEFVNSAVCAKEQELTRSEISHVHTKIDAFTDMLKTLGDKVDKVLVNLTS